MRPSLSIVIVASLAGCVVETSVAGDDRSVAACAEAMLIELPRSGCTETFVFESNSPLGCAIRDLDGDEIGSEQGSWLRVRRPVDRPGRVEIRDLTPTPGGVELAHVILSGGGVPSCACVRDRAGGILVRSEFVSMPLPYAEQELLFTALHTFEVRVCNDTADPFPTCFGNAPAGGGPACDPHPAFATDELCACLPDCDRASDCPQPVTGNARVSCEEWGCTLRCDGGETCPAGFECIPVAEHGQACAAPFE